MLQPFAFKGEEFSDVYRSVRAFLYRLSLSGISVSLPDGYRSNTKYYPDYGSTMTVVEVFPDIAVAEQVEQVETIYADVLAMNLYPDASATVEEPSYPIEEASLLLSNAGAKMFLDYCKDGWLLIDKSDGGHVFYGVPRDEVLDRVKYVLGIENTADDPDFDPFLPLP